MKKYFYLLVFILLFNLTKIQAQYNEIFTIGPMIHLNIGEKIRPSIGLEFAYWNYNGFPFSINFGIDKQKAAFRMYSEMQTGIALLGASAGPFWEIRSGEENKIGLQTNLWANYFVGGNLRLRFYSGENAVFAPGVYAKYMWFKDPEHHKNNNNSSWDWDDWD